MKLIFSLVVIAAFVLPLASAFVAEPVAAHPIDACLWQGCTD